MLGGYFGFTTLRCNVKVEKFTTIATTTIRLARRCILKGHFTFCKHLFSRKYSLTKNQICLRNQRLREQRLVDNTEIMSAYSQGLRGHRLSVFNIYVNAVSAQSGSIPTCKFGKYLREIQNFSKSCFLLIHEVPRMCYLANNLVTDYPEVV